MRSSPIRRIFYGQPSILVMFCYGQSSVTAVTVFSIAIAKN